jgi:hypothetical protein
MCTNCPRQRHALSTNGCTHAPREMLKATNVGFGLMRAVVLTVLLATLTPFPTCALQTGCATIGNHSAECVARPECGWCYDRCFDKQVETCCSLPSTDPGCDGPGASVCSGRQVCNIWNYTAGGCLYSACCPAEQRLCGDFCYDPAIYQCCEYPNPLIVLNNATCCQGSYPGAVPWCPSGSYCCGDAVTVCCPNDTTCDKNRFINKCLTSSWTAPDFS